jgi:Flp pilus assembly protein TadD
LIFGYASVLVAALVGRGIEPRAPVDAAVDAAARARGEPARALTSEARAALDAKELERAREAAARAARRAPDDGEAWRLLGMALFRDRRAADAVAPFERAASLQPTSAVARFNLGSALLETGRAAEAERAYLDAARLDEKVAPLALYDAGLAAARSADDQRAAASARASADERADAHLRAAVESARAAGAAPIAERASARLDERGRARRDRARARVRGLMQQGKDALAQGRAYDAAEAYRAALAAADADEQQVFGDADRAELEYALGHALYQQGILGPAARAFAAAATLAPRDPEFQLMLGLVRMRLGADAEARAALSAALALGLTGDDAARARGYLAAIAAEPRFTLDARAGGGWDSDVPESNQIIVEPSGAATSERAAGFLSADLDVSYRPVGTSRSGVTLEYRFGQTAYLSSALDLYSLQEHDVSAAAAYTLRDRLKLELGIDGYLLFAGVQTFGFFQAGVAVGPRVTVDEGHGLETAFRYVHVFKASLDPNYDYLSGARDEAAVSQTWRTSRGRVRVGYQFTDEAIGAQVIGTSQLEAGCNAVQGQPVPPPPLLPCDDTYTIPYSYYGNQVSLMGVIDLPWSLHGQLMLRYEHRDYPKESVVFDPITLTNGHRRLRIDDRFTVDATLRRTLRWGLHVEFAYTLVVNRSTIDFTNPSTPYDYDNKNYFKHVLMLELTYSR